jgi:hypothetical protein
MDDFQKVRILVERCVYPTIYDLSFSFLDCVQIDSMDTLYYQKLQKYRQLKLSEMNLGVDFITDDQSRVFDEATTAFENIMFEMVPIY